MKKLFLFFIALLFIGISQGQSVGIGTSTPDTSAALDVSSTTKGFLPPRMTFAQRNAILNPVAGLVIWCADCGELQVYNGTIWKNMNGSDASSFPLPGVTIGNQVWTLKSLDVTTYSNGDAIPQVTDKALWDGLTTGAWCYYNNDLATGAVYGKLYNWYAVSDPRGLAPTGWHIPTDAELTTLITFLGGASVAGGKMKATTLWNSPNTGATNESGFTGLPGGLQQGQGGHSSKLASRATGGFLRHPPGIITWTIPQPV